MESPAGLEDDGGGDLAGLLARVKGAEFRQWTSVNAAMGRGDSGAVLSLLRVYESLAGQRVKLEAAITELQLARGELVTIDQAKLLIREAHESLLGMLRGMGSAVSSHANPENPDMAREAIEAAVDQIQRAMSDGG